MADPAEIEMTADGFARYIGRMLRIESAPDCNLTLDRVEPGPPAPSPHRSPFALIFSGPKPGPVLAEGMHAGQIEGGPAVRIYISPIHTPRPDRQDYQSVFN